MNVIDNFFQSVNNLPMMPKVVQEVIQMLNNEEVDLKDVVEKINLDQVISAKVLRLSNSSYYGLSRKVNNLNDAISLIGVSSLRTLVIASGVTSAFKTIPNIDMHRFWRHSLITASIARDICKIQKKPSETAYVAALMHSIGQLLIHIVFPTGGRDIEEMCRGQSVLERKSVENATLGIDHCQVGEELAKRWNFPEEIQRVIRYYADPLNPKACELAPVVYMAAHIAFGLELNQDAKHIAETINTEVIKALDFHRIEWIDRIESYKAFVTEADNFI